MSYQLERLVLTLFKDSKVIEKISSLLDVLLSGSTESIAREPYEICGQKSAYAEKKQPVRLAGKVIIRRERVCSVLDSPYTAFPASTVLGIESSIYTLITIENQTTFHTEARRLHDNDVLLIYNVSNAITCMESDVCTNSFISI